MALPALRPVDAFPVEHEGAQYFCLSDPTGMVEEQLLLTGPALFVAAQLTGTTEVSDVQGAFREQFDGEEIAAEQILEVVGTLDAGGFLLSERYFELEREIEDGFRNAETRAAHLAGKSYPEDADELRRFLSDQFFREGGPGESLGQGPGSGRPLPGLVVPHIDYHRGGHSYAHGYLRMYRAGRPDTVFVFGVAHATEPVPFILTRKHFETPLGTVETDRECVDALARACDWDPYAYELTHRTEHSIEFQVVMLAHLYGTDIRIVPILCSALTGGSASDHPEDVRSVQRFLGACRECLATEDKQFSVIAGADLAHVGRRFGDPFDITDDVVDAVSLRDTEDLAHVGRNDAAEFYASVMRDDNERNVCGVNCIYAALKTLEGSIEGGERVHYDYAHDPAGGIVSFASMTLQ